MTEPCPVCDTALNSSPTGIGTSADVNEYSCPRCGRFRLTSEVQMDLPTQLSANKDNKAKISHALRRAQEANSIAYLDEATFKRMLEVPLPRPREQADLLIRWIANASDGPGEDVKYSSLEAEGVAGAKNAQGLKLILQHLEESKLLQSKPISRISTDPIDKASQLTFDGWEHFEKIQAGTIFYRKAFMAMKYGEVTLDSLFESTLKPSAKLAGFDLIRQDQTHRAGLIDNLMRVNIQTCDFVIADLTHHNPGAYWEAGYAEGLGKPVIFTCKKSVFDRNKTHFDTNHHTTIVWDEKDPGVAGEKLTATIRATLPHLAKMSD